MVCKHVKIFDSTVYNFSINGSIMENVKSYRHLGHVINSTFDDTDDIEDKRNSFTGQVNSVLCYFGKLSSATKLHLFNSHCTSFFGCELWNLNNCCIESVSIAWRKALRRIWALPAMTHGYLLPTISNCLPIYDMICLRSMSFLVSCLNHAFIHNFANYAIFYGGMDSPQGRNFLLCAERFELNTANLFNRSNLHCFVYQKCSGWVTPLQRSYGNLLQELLALREQSRVFSAEKNFLTVYEIDDIIRFVALEDIT